MHYLALAAAFIFASGGYWFPTTVFYNFNPAASLAIILVALAVRQRQTQGMRVHDRTLYQMYVTVSKEQERYMQAIMEHLGVQDPYETTADKRKAKPRKKLPPTPNDPDDDEDPDYYRL